MEAIYAVDLKNGLSKNGSIPWNCKKDMSFFMNKTKIMWLLWGKILTFIYLLNIDLYQID
jgi:dihydrofolate reductase